VNQRKAGVSLSYLSIILTNLIGIVYTPFLLRMLGQSEYGLYALAASIVSYLSVMDFGFGNATVRYTALYKAKEKEPQLPYLWGMMFVVYALMSIIALIAGLVVSYHADILFSRSMTMEELTRVRLLILLMTCNITFSLPLTLFESIVVAYERFKYQRGLQLLRTLLQPVIMIPLLLLGYKSIALVLLITALNLCYLSANVWYCFRKLDVKIFFNRFDVPLLKEIIQYSFWVFLIMVVDRLYWSSGQIILGALAGTSAVAVFAVAIQFKNYFSSFSTAISGVFLPKITSLNRKKDLDAYFIKIGRLQFIIISFILSGFIIFGRSFINLWAGENYDEAYRIALIILIPLSVPLMQTLGISILQAQNRLKFRSILYLLMALLSIFVSVFLAKLYGGMGCAVSIALSLILCNIIIMNIYYYRRINLDIPRFWKEIIAMSLPIILLDSVVFLLSKQITLPQSWGLFFMQVAIFSVLFLFVLYKWTMNPYEKSLFADLLAVSVKKRRR